MSDIANISVMRCDGEGCSMIAVIQTEQDRETFEAGWFAGLGRDLCPACKDALANQAIRVDEEQRMSAIAQAAVVRPIRPVTLAIVDDDSSPITDHLSLGGTNGNAAA